MYINIYMYISKWYDIYIYIDSAYKCVYTHLSVLTVFVSSYQIPFFPSLSIYIYIYMYVNVCVE